MIDLHCHLLPGIDDGASDMEQALLLARMAVANGITASVLTPHIHIGYFDNDKESIAEAFGVFSKALKAESIPLRVAMAAEVRLSAEIMPQILRGELPFLGRWQGEDVMLLEMPHSHIPAGTDQLIHWLHKQGVTAMIAHPERNKDVIRDFKNIKPLLSTGCLFQVTAGAVAGRFGEPAQWRAEQLLAQGCVTVLASDAHHESRRPPELEPGRIAAESIVGESASWDLVRTNPKIITAMHFQDY